MSYRCRRLVAFIALESWASHAASCPIHLITLSRAPCDYNSLVVGAPEANKVKI